jgi:hypothetical protein
MLRFRPALALPLLIAALLGACGGGGGGSSGAPGTPPPASGPALAFSPAKVTASVAAGTSGNLNVSASVNRPSDFDGASSVFALVVDDKGVLLPTSKVVQDSAVLYHAVLQTAPTLAAGTYSGNFTVKLCRDSACASQFPGSPMLLPYELAVTPAGATEFSATSAMPLTASMHLGGAAPAAATVAIKSEGRNWTAAAADSWVSVTPSSGTGSGSLAVGYQPAGLAVGQYSSSVTVSASDGQKAVLPVALTVLPVGFAVDSNGVSFNAVNGAPIATQSVAFGLDNGAAAAWSAISDAGWLKATPGSGTTPAAVILTVDPSASTLASGSYNGNIVFSSPGIVQRTLPVALTLVKPTLLGSASTLTLGGTYGRDFSAQPFSMTLNTSTNAWPWTLSGLPAWVSANISAGSVSKVPASILLTPDPTKAAVGSSTTVLGPIARVNGDQVQAAVRINLNKDQHKLLPSATGIALSGTPGWSSLSRTITISDNYGGGAAWTASASQPWLTLAVTATTLTMTVDPSSLAIDSYNSADVTLTPADADVAAPEAIRVGFWKGTFSPVANSTLPLPYVSVTADPVRPYVYAHNGGAFIDVYNVYNNQKLGTITGLSASLGDMAVTPNGDKLYVVDLNSHTLAGVNLATLRVATQWALPAGAGAATRLRLIRPNGVEIAVLSDGTTYLTASGQRGPGIGLPGGTLDAPADGKHLYLQDEGNATVQLATFSVDYAALGGGTLFAAKQTQASHAGTGTLGQDIAASPDGSKVYTATSTPRLCTALNPADLGSLYYLPTGDVAPNNVEVGSDGRVYCGVAGKTSPADVWVYSSSGALLKQLKFAASGQQLRPRQMVISGDGFMLIGLTDAGVANMAPVGP